MDDPLRVLRGRDDRRCRARTLDNGLRRWLAPPSRDLDPLDLRPGSVVADLGAGVGYHAPEILARIGANGRLYLVDPDAANLDIARQRIGPRANVVGFVGSAARVDRIPSETVDRLLMSLVLCCLVDKEGAMDEAYRILRPNGLLLVTYPRIGWSPYRRKRSLRVDRARWSALRARRPWEELACPQGRVVVRHLLRRGRTAADGGEGGGGAAPGAAV